MLTLGLRRISGGQARLARGPAPRLSPGAGLSLPLALPVADAEGPGRRRAAGNTAPLRTATAGARPARALQRPPRRAGSSAIRPGALCDTDRGRELALLAIHEEAAKPA